MAPANSSVPYKKWIRFLKKHDLHYKRTKGDHEVWDKQDNRLRRPVIFRTGKDQPLFHIKTNLDTMGIKMKQFLAEIKDC